MNDSQPFSQGPHEQASLSTLLGASLNQKRAPLDVRSIAANSQIDWNGLIQKSMPVNCAWFILSTCNRFEIYLYGPSVEPEHVRTLLARAFGHATHGASLHSVRATHGDTYHNGTAPADNKQPGADAGIARYFDILEGRQAARHMFRVAAGLESKVFGESQILGQLIRGYQDHIAARTLNHELDAVLLAAIRAGKRVRHETSIGANAGSIASLAIQTVETQFRNLSQSTVAVVGLGEMGRLVAGNLAARGVGRLVLTNRTTERADELARELKAKAVPWTRLAEVLAHADVVFCATSAQLPVITPQLLSMVPKSTVPASATGAGTAPVARKLLVDLAVPRDVDPAMVHFPSLQVIDLDQLRTDLDENLAQRHAALPPAERILHDEMVMLEARMRELAHRPLIVDLRQKAEHIRQQELARTLRFIQDADPETVRHIEHLSRALVNKLLHEPTTRIREMAGCADQPVPDALVRDLFGLMDEPVVNEQTAKRSDLRCTNALSQPEENPPPTKPAQEDSP